MSVIPPEGQGGGPAGQGGVSGQPAGQPGVPPGSTPPPGQPQPPYPPPPPHQQPPYQPPQPPQPQQPPYQQQPPQPQAPTAPVPTGQPATGHGAFKSPPPATAGGKRFGRPDWLDMKALIAIIIGLVSFSGALLTWRAATLSSNATGADRQSILETVVQQQNSVAVESQLRFEEAAFARFKSDTVNAQKMRDEADQLRKSGLGGQADQLEDDANRLENLALVAARDTGNAYTYDDKGVPQFDEAGRRFTLSHQDEAASQANPEQQVTFADKTRKRSQRLVGFLPILVFAIVLLTIAQLLRRDRLRPFIAGAGTLIWIVAIVVAFVGDKG